MKQNEITHVVLCLDASPSMLSFERDCAKVADNLIQHLAQSKVAGEEIRITIYSFWETAQCLIYDMDVLRVPKVEGLYKCGGVATALKDTTMLALNDLAMTPEKYGEHAFLVYVLTDGMDNRSLISSNALTTKINGLPDHWSVGVFMPGERFRRYAVDYGFPSQNIDVWDASSKAGFEDVGRRIVSTTDDFLTMRRTTGSRSTKGRSLFNLQLNTLSGADIVNNLKPLSFDKYALWPVSAKQEIRPFVEDHGYTYITGHGYYELTKNETIQPSKTFAILYNNRIYTGPEARKLLGLPENGDYAPVKAEKYPNYVVFVQSGSVNRNLIPGQRLLYLF